MFRAFVLATALALASVGTATAQDAGRSNLESANAAYGRGDYAEAARQYRMAADQGFAAGQVGLAFMYEQGRGVPQNDAEAVRWFRMAADQGFPSAQRNLGSMYRYGRGVPQNDAEAARQYRMAADQDYAGAQLELGLMYENGLGVPQDSVEGLKWVSLAWDQKYLTLMEFLDFSDRHLRSAEQNAEVGRRIAAWYRMAANRGYPRAQTVVGDYYYDGEGVPQNDAEAVRWFRMAADQGYARGQVSLGLMYENGRGVPQNYAEAYKWYALSAAQGNADAVTYRDRVLGKMTPAQIAEGQRLVAAAWRPR